jgi:quercetin dioxygenase-like cupin family protein
MWVVLGRDRISAPGVVRGKWFVPSLRKGRGSMAKAGEVFENPVTGERAVVRLGTEDTGGDRVVVDLYVKPSGAVSGEHVHPVTEESFTVVRGRVASA